MRPVSMLYYLFSNSGKPLEFNVLRLVPELLLDQDRSLSVTLILTELSQHNLINVSYLTACYLYQVMMTLHFLNDVANDAESTQTSKITL